MKSSSPGFSAPFLGRTLVIAAGLLGTVIVLDGMKAAFLDDLPFREPENLVTMSGVGDSGSPDYTDLFAGRPTLEAVTKLGYGRATWNRSGQSLRIDVLAVDHVILGVLGLSVSRGRAFSRADRAEPATALVSRSFLERTLEEPEGRLGQDLEINGQHFTVIGVAPAALSRLGRFDVVLPRKDGRAWFRMGEATTPFSQISIGRKRSSATLAQVQAEVEALQRSREGPGQGTSTVRVGSLPDRLVAPSLPALQMLSFAAVVLVLLSAVTVAMLAAMLSAERLGEFAVRSALGATPRRLRREAMQPWLRATLPATGLALILAAPISAWIWSTLPTLGEVRILSLDTVLSTLFIGFLLTAVAALGTLIPQHMLSRQLGAGLGAITHDPRGHRIGRILATVQVALSVALFCGAAVAAQALKDQSSRDLGIKPDGLFQIEVHLGEGRTEAEASAAWRRIAIAIQGTPPETAMASALPWTPIGGWWLRSDQNAKGKIATVTNVGPGFFKTLGIRFIEGSDPFTAAASEDAVVLSAALAKSLGARVGSIVNINSGDPARVAGIVNDVFDPTLKPRAQTLQMYLSPGFKSGFVLNTSVFARGSIAEVLALRSILAAALPWASIGEPSPLQGLLAGRLERERLGAMVLSAYAFLACVLIAFGLGGMMRRRVAQRMKEVGIRLVLGASRRQIDEAMLRPITIPALLGLALGLALGFQLSQSVASLMPWAEPLEPAIYVGATMAGTLIVLLAAWPALRAATRTVPAALLRHL